MLHREFAISPDQIQDIRDIQILVGRFGFDKGALISTYPKQWFRTVAERLKIGVSDRQPDSMTDMLQEFKRNCLSGFGRDYEEGDWHQSAINSHGKQPFHRLVGVTLEQPPQIIPSILNLKDSDFHIENQVFRTANAMADAASLLLRSAEKVTLVDPYFCLTKPGYRNTLIELINKCKKPKVKFVIFSEEEKKADWKTQRKPALESFAQDLLPEGYSLQWFSISDNQSGYIHARALFTGKGGIKYDRGFETPNIHDQQSTPADIDIMRAVEWQQKVDDYNEVQIPDRFSLVESWASG